MEPILKRNLKMDKIIKKQHTSKPQVLQHIIQIPDIQNHIPEDKIITEKDPDIIIQYIDLASQQRILLFRLVKARQWWQNLDQTYFKPVKLKNILLVRDLTSVQKLSNFFSNQGHLQSTFQEEEIFSNCPHLKQNALIHVLLKSATPFAIELVSFSFVNYIQTLSKRGQKSLKEQTPENDALENIEITSCINKMKNPSIFTEVKQDEVQQVLKVSKFQFQFNLQEDSLLSKIQRAQQTKFKLQLKQDVQVQLELWSQQAHIQNSHNSILWNNLLSNHSRNIETEVHDYKTQVFLIKQQLMHHTILRYMEHGTKDKTQQMLRQLLENMKQIKPAKTRQTINKKFFQTDCKICFCSFNSDSNQVLYCDMCNTSFHLACYGLYEVPQQKEYFCDRCTLIIKEDKIKSNSKKITCQICCKPNFPVKQIDGHYYHMTCLILFNFITIKQGKIQLQQGLTHQAIIKKVIQSQLQCLSCIFCSAGPGAEMGMQFRCNFQGCESSMHPICAYINGCRLNVKRLSIEKKIGVDILCNKHDCERDYIQQTYLRRYMCNFKNTSQKSLQSFRAQYQAEIRARKPKQTLKTHTNSQLPDIIIDTKVIRKHIGQRQQKKIEKNEDITNTQTRKILEKLVKSHF